jgi:CheY-like chemotaxis protein
MASTDTTACRILVVDDEPLVCDSISQMLALDGHVVQTATGGQAALALLQQATLDLIIVDYEMPGMKGDKLAAAVKALDPRRPVLMMTAFPEMLASSGNPLVGVDWVIHKPFGLQEPRQAIAKLHTKT